MLTPQSVAVSLRRTLRRTDIIPGGAIGVDPQAKVCVIRKITDEVVDERYDYLVLAPGSITRTFDIPGLTDYARGMKTLAEADLRPRPRHRPARPGRRQPLDQDERDSRLQFVVVGGGYAGTETAACLQRLTTAARQALPAAGPPADQVAPDRHRAQAHARTRRPPRQPGAGGAARARRRGLARRLGGRSRPTDEVTFTDGRVLPSRTLIWTAGVAASPLIGTLDAETRARPDRRSPPRCGCRLFEGMFALGDAAAVPDLAKGDGAVCPPTAQHAMRQGKRVADNLLATLRGQPLQPYFHKDLGPGRRPRRQGRGLQAARHRD